MDQRSKPYFFAFETKARPGFLRCHAVRIETIDLPMRGGGVDETQFTLFPADYDKDQRIRQLCATAAAFLKNNGIQPE